MRVPAICGLTLLALMMVGCGGGSSAPQSSPLNGNWQVNMVQNYPAPQAQLVASGFLVQSSSGLAGSVQGPTVISSNQSHECGGVGPLAGTVSGNNVTFSLNPGGTTFTFNGIISSDNTSMSGDYEAVGGACFSGAGSTGTWTASLIPPVNGAFSGTLSNSSYMSALTGMSPPAPIAVSGTLTQSSNAGASNATVTGTITATGYPCFTTASVSGTISGQSVYLDVFDYSGVQIGTIGLPGVQGVPGTPAIAAGGSSGTTLSGTGQAGLSLGAQGVAPCPALIVNGTTFTTDLADVALTLK